MFDAIFRGAKMYDAIHVFGPSAFIAIYNNLNFRVNIASFLVKFVSVINCTSQAFLIVFVLLPNIQMKDKAHLPILSSISAQFVLFSYLSDRTHLRIIIKTMAFNKLIWSA